MTDEKKPRAGVAMLGAAGKIDVLPERRFAFRFSASSRSATMPMPVSPETEAEPDRDGRADVDRCRLRIDRLGTVVTALAVTGGRAVHGATPETEGCNDGNSRNNSEFHVGLLDLCTLGGPT